MTTQQVTAYRVGQLMKNLERSMEPFRGFDPEAEKYFEERMAGLRDLAKENGIELRTEKNREADQ